MAAIASVVRKSLTIEGQTVFTLVAEAITCPPVKEEAVVTLSVAVRDKLKTRLRINFIELRTATIRNSSRIGIPTTFGIPTIDVANTIPNLRRPAKSRITRVRPIIFCGIGILAIKVCRIIGARIGVWETLRRTTVTPVVITFRVVIVCITEPVSDLRLIPGTEGRLPSFVLTIIEVIIPIGADKVEAVDTIIAVTIAHPI